MRYLGIDVHSAASVWCLLDPEGQQVEEGKVATTAPALQSLVQRLAGGEELLVGQEVGTMAYFVHDVVTAAGAVFLMIALAHINRRGGRPSATILEIQWDLE